MSNYKIIISYYELNNNSILNSFLLFFIGLTENQSEAPKAGRNFLFPQPARHRPVYCVRLPELKTFAKQQLRQLGNSECQRNEKQENNIDILKQI